MRDFFIILLAAELRSTSRVPELRATQTALADRGQVHVADARGRRPS